MKSFTCTCGQRLFFENSQCLSCGRRVGWCPACQDLTALDLGEQSGRFVCASPDCGARLELCYNYEQHNVCNRCVTVQEAGSGGAHSALCDMCRFNDTIPDLSIPGNLQAWARLEVAKRRVLRQFQLLHLPPFDGKSVGPPLSFDFLADAIPANLGWRTMDQETVYTGHVDGRITINIREADSVERERLRVSFGESYRTLTGHFRHELAHYLWDACVRGTDREAGFREAFGDPYQPTYEEALQAYYQNGPRPDWPSDYISAYATMHPFEDWAETTAVFLNGHATLETAVHHGYAAATPNLSDPNAALDQFSAIGDFLNEVSREMGLLDVMPSVLTPLVRRKLLFVRDVLLPGSS